MHRLLFIACLLAVAPWAAASDSARALADREQFAPGQWWRYYYLSTAASREEDRAYLETAIRFVIPSMTPRQPVLESCLPVQVAPTLWRIDVGQVIDAETVVGCGWDAAAWRKAIRDYPYADNHNSLVLRADWLLVQLTDSHESTAYYDLVYPGAKTRDDVLVQLGVDQRVRFQHGMIEGQSGISKQRVRILKSLSAPRGFAWGTFDYLSLEPDQDPLEQPEGDSRHDGEEWLFGFYKTHLGTGATGVLMGSMLANGAGVLVDRAPVDLVEDHTAFRGFREVRNAGSCIQCHSSGLNLPTRNELRSIGVPLDAYSEADWQRLRAFHFADLAKELRRDNEDFRTMVELACGRSPQDAATAYEMAVRLYDEPLDLADAARELGVEAEELRLALAAASADGQNLGVRIASLAHGGRVPRDAWESGYLAVEQFMHAWSHR